ncbi:MAG: hypothetical protein ACPGJS_00575 [Flammeovirgaceae bacterium]
MKLSKEQYKELEQFAGVFFSIQEIATVMELDGEALKHAYEDPSSDIHQTIQRGRLKQEAELRKIIFNLAKGGSSPAQNLALKIIQEAKIDAF